MRHLPLLTPALGSAVGLVLLGGLAAAQQSPGSNQQSSPTPTPSVSPSSSASPSATQVVDLASAINFLHHTNELEIQESNEALSRLTDPSATQLAQTLVSDHTTNEQQVVQIASRKSLRLFAFQAATYELAADAALRDLSGSAYDSTFKVHELTDHQEVLQRLQSMATKVTDPDVLNLINQTIPIVQKHIQLAGGQTGAVEPSASPSTHPSAQPSVQPSARQSGTPSGQIYS